MLVSFAARAGNVVARIVCVSAVLFCIEPHARSQSAGSVTGVVRIQGAGAASAASVALNSPELNQHRSAKTDAKGNFEFANVAPGRYSIQVTGAGLKTYQRGEIPVGAG